MSADKDVPSASGQAKDAVEVVREFFRKCGGSHTPLDGIRQELSVLRGRLRRVRALAPAFRAVDLSPFVSAMEWRGRE